MVSATFWAPFNSGGHGSTATNQPTTSRLPATTGGSGITKAAAVPAGFAAEMQKMSRPATFYAVHLKARYRAQVAQELLAHRLANVEIAKFGTAYEF